MQIWHYFNYAINYIRSHIHSFHSALVSSKSCTSSWTDETFTTVWMLGLIVFVPFQLPGLQDGWLVLAKVGSHLWLSMICDRWSLKWRQTGSRKWTWTIIMLLQYRSFMRWIFCAVTYFCVLMSASWNNNKITEASLLSEQHS